MRKMLMIMAVLAMVAVVLVPACAQQGRRGQREGGGQMSEAERAQMREQMIERMLEQTGLTDEEKVAAKAALIAKQEARRVLAEELAKLRAAAENAEATDEELQGALTAYRAAMTQYHDTVEAQDATLAEQLSLRSEVQCMLLGILQNGVGMRGGMRGPDGGGRGGEGEGGRRGGRGGQ